MLPVDVVVPNHKPTAALHHYLYIELLLPLLQQPLRLLALNARPLHLLADILLPHNHILLHLCRINL